MTLLWSLDSGTNVPSRVGSLYIENLSKPINFDIYAHSSNRHIRIRRARHGWRPVDLCANSCQTASLATILVEMPWSSDSV